MFKHTDIPCAHCGDCKFEYLPERKIPGHYSENHSQRLKSYITLFNPCINEFVFQKFYSIFSIIITDLSTFLNFGSRLLYWLPHFLCNNLGIKIKIFPE